MNNFNYRNLKEIHIGSLIKQKLEEKGMNITEFSRKINCDRTTVYYLMQRKSIDIEQLVLISEILEFDFIREIYLL